MCSNNEDDTVATMIKAEVEPINFQETCKKCNQSKVAVKLKFKEAQCEKCFLAYVRHKFRASLGSTKIVSRGSTILIVYDGKPKSSVLLDMLRFAFFQDAYKKLHFEPHVLYIDDSAVFNLTDEQRCDQLQRVKVLLEQYGFKSYGTSITDSTNCLQSFEDYMKQVISNDEVIEFKTKLLSAGSHTSADDYIGNIRTNIIRNVASKLNANFAFTSEIESDLAKIFLTNVTLGRGSSVCQDIAFCDTRGAVPIIRPIRNLDVAEVDHYIKFNKIECLDVHAMDVDGMFEKSLQNVTKSFIDELQTNYPSTISTIFRTGDKISGIWVDKGEVDVEGRCTFCGSGIGAKKSETIQALEYSRYVSENTCDVRLNFVSDDRGNLTKCYGCRNIFKDLLISNESE
ncbi:hypothetical protein HA402_005339 [Bradysia odoriphaga]|nr:hypothetical protein HA402_005339 [Bradysia odoriphaga]